MRAVAIAHHHEEAKWKGRSKWVIVIDGVRTRITKLVRKTQKMIIIDLQNSFLVSRGIRACYAPIL